MNIIKLSLKIIGQIIFVIIFFSTLQAKNLDKFNEAEYIFINEAQFFKGLRSWVLYVKNTLKKNIILNQKLKLH